MKKIIVALMLVFVLILISGCTKGFEPDISVIQSTKSVTIESGIASEYVTWDITRLDSKDQGTTFTLVFDNKESVYAVDIDGNKIPQIITKELKGKNAKDSLQFKVNGIKSTEDTFAEKELELHLLWNGTSYKDETITVRVQ